MARATRVRVSKSSGQGVSRLSYQKGRQLGNKGSGTPGDTGIEARFSGPDIKGPGTTGGKRGYAKGDKEGGFNVSYGSTIHPSDIEDVKALGKMELGKRKALGPTSTKKLK